MKHSVFLAALVMLVAMMGMMQALVGLAPFKWWILRHYGWRIAGASVVTFVVLAGLFYRISLLLPLRHTGRKLTHVDRQLATSEGVFEDLPADEEEA
jgi:hypothetical protein